MKQESTNKEELMTEQQNTSHTSRKRRKKKPGPRTFVIGAAAVLALGAAMVFGGLNSTAPVDADSDAVVLVQIAQGENADQITAKLKELGVIDNELAFKYYLKTHNASGKLRAGSYQLSPAMTTNEIVEELLNGVGDMVRFTIPEGYTLRDIAQTLAQADIMQEDTFWTLVQSIDVSDYPFLANCPNDDHRLEGFLFPDTYFMAKGTAPETVIRMMLDRFAEVWADLPANASGLSDYDTVILASLVESEAKLDTERPTIASVYINRLAKQMPMQCDATILYAMPERKTQLRFSDYKYESVYNTYLHQGLPPTPISNPGRASLEAARQPENTDYLYYLWDKIENDGHVFAETYEGHLQNRKTYGYD